MLPEAEDLTCDVASVASTLDDLKYKEGYDGDRAFSKCAEG